MFVAIHECEGNVEEMAQGLGKVPNAIEGLVRVVLTSDDDFTSSQVSDAYRLISSADPLHEPIAISTLVQEAVARLGAGKSTS